MTTLLLPPNEIAMLRTMKGLAYLLAVMITLDRNYPGRAFRTEQVALVAGLDARTASKQLQDLSALDHVILTSSGYVLTQGGRAMFLSAAPEAQDLAQLPKAQAQQALEAHDNTRSVRALKTEVEEESFNKKIFNSSSSTSVAQNVRGEKHISTKSILEETSLLDRFEQGVFLHGLNVEMIHPRMALGWIAQAYDQRSKLGKPAGLVYSRLKDVEQPRPQSKYYEGWSSYLPDEYLEAVGIPNVYSCGVCGKEFSKHKEFDDHKNMMLVCEYKGCGARFHEMSQLEEHYNVDHATEEQQIVLEYNQDSEIAQAWRQVLDLLYSQMPKVSYLTWVKETRVVDYDGEIVTIGAKNSYACEWLDSRLSSAVRRMLVGILDRDLDVVFVTANIAEGDADE